MVVYAQHIMVGLLICWFVATIKLTDQRLMRPYDQSIIFYRADDTQRHVMSGLKNVFVFT